MPRIVVPLPWTEQPLEHITIANEWAGRIPNVLVQSLDMSVDGSPITTIGTVGKVVNAGGVMSSHASTATNIQRTPFRNPYATGSGTGLWLLVQFTTVTNQEKVIAGLGSDTGSSGNTIFSFGIDVDGTLRSLHGGSNSNSAWQDSNVVVTDGKVHTALMYTATTPSGATAIYKGFLDGKKYLDTTEVLALGDLAYGHLVAGGTRRTTDLAGFDGNVGLVAVILDDMPDDLAISLTSNPWQIFEDEEFPVWFSTTTGISGTIAAVWEAFTSSIIGTTTIVGSMAQTLDSSVGNLQGTTTIVGTIAKTLENDIGNFVGNTGTSGTIAVTAQDDTASMVGQTTIVGSMAATTEDATSSMTGSTTILGSMAQTIVDFVAALYGTSGTATIVAKLRAMIGVGQ